MNPLRKTTEMMDAKGWEKTIAKQMKEAGTYSKTFSPTIKSLADILEQRDRAYEDFIESGGKTVVERVSDRGSVYMQKNPRLQVWMDLNAQALAYWRDCGLTPAGLKKLNDMALKEKRGSALDEALKKIAGA